MLLVAWSLLSCASGGSERSRSELPSVEARSATDRTANVELLERVLSMNPRHPNLRLDLGSAYLRLAQAELGAGREDLYISNLARAEAHLLDEIAAYPESSAAHNLLAVLSAYRGDLAAARVSFGIARQLDPDGSAPQINLAELSVFEGRLAEARRWLRGARERGASPAEVALIRSLIAWRERDLVEARDQFEQARELGAEHVDSWNGASALPSFEALASHCCQLTFCGPYMADACGDMQQAVSRQERAEATLLEELRLQMERMRRLREVYERRRDLEVRVDELAEPASAPSAEVPSAP